MDTRCGDIDPGILLYLADTLGLSPPELDELLNKRSGVAGMCGLR
jgi:acetate kinase